MSPFRSIAAGAVAVASLLASGTAFANHGANVQWSVTIGSPAGLPVLLPPPPVLAVPAPVYVRPAPVYAPPYPAYRVEPYPWHHHPHWRYREPTRWDRDGDGIPDRHDRVYNPRWDVDGDGIPNRHDRRDDRRGRW